MKKVIFALAAVVALAACSKEQTVVADRGDAIGFGTPFVENATRASYSDNGVLVDQFNVYGTVTGENSVALFGGDGAVVSRGNKAYGAIWECSETEYWIPNCTYEFEAVVDGAINNGTITYSRGQNIGSDSVSDLLYAKANVETDASSVPSGDLGTEQTYNGVGVRPVAFTFTHLLSKVKFTVESNATGDYSHTVTNVVLTGYNSGTYTISHNASGELDGTWKGDLVDGKLSSIEVSDLTSDMLLIPISDSFNVSFTVNTYKGAELLSSEVFGTEEDPITIDTDLVAGNAYNFKISCELGLPITFTFDALDGWGPKEGETDPIITIK